MSSASPTPHGISIVCVYNDDEVRRDCLDRSVEALRTAGPIDYVPVDNREHRFTSAGAALNHGAAEATGDVLVFAHQDVYFHSWDHLARVADAARTGVHSLIGAVGIDPSGGLFGRMRDRVILLGADVPEPVEVDSVDEVAFAIHRDTLTAHPLTEDPDLSWHAYAVEYGLRGRQAGLQTSAMNMAVTHNSLTINLARLTEAHQHLARRFPDDAPVVTTCGVVGSPQRSVRSIPVLKDHTWRYRWVQDSLQVRNHRDALGDTRIVLADIRRDVDDLTVPDGQPLHVVNVDTDGGFHGVDDVPLRLLRRGRPVEFRSVGTLTGLGEALAGLRLDASVLVTGMALADLGQTVAPTAGRTRIAGFQRDTGVWLVTGRAAANPPTSWSDAAATPLGHRSERH